MTALFAGNGVEEAEPALADAGATDSDLRIAFRSLGCSLATRVKLRDDGTTVLEALEGSAGAETCCCGTRKPTNAINATAIKAAIPAASSPVENDLGAEVEFMMTRVKISKLMQLVQPGERRDRVAGPGFARCRPRR